MAGSFLFFTLVFVLLDIRKETFPSHQRAKRVFGFGTLK